MKVFKAAEFGGYGEFRVGGSDHGYGLSQDNIERIISGARQQRGETPHISLRMDLTSVEQLIYQLIREIRSQ